MEKYAYQAKDEVGALFRGEVAGDSLRDAVQELRQRGWYVTKIEKVHSSELAGAGRWPWQRMKQREIVLLCRQLAAMLSAGLPLLETVKVLQGQMQNSVLQRALANVVRQIESGTSLTAALQTEKQVFPQTMVYMIAAGEASGTLDVVLSRLAAYLERDYKAAEKLLSVMLYPLLLLLMTMLVVGFILCFVLPIFVTLFANLQTVLPLPTRVLLCLSDWLSAYWWLCLLFFGLAMGCGRKLYALPEYRFFWDGFLLRLPVLGDLLYKTAAMRISSTLAVLLRSGMMIDEAVGVVKNIATNACFVVSLQKAQLDLRRGYSLSQTLGEGKLFDPLFLQLLTVGETTGELDVMLQKITDFYEIDVAVLSERVGTLVEPLMILVLGVVVGTVVLSIALPLFDAMTAIH